MTGSEAEGIAESEGGAPAEPGRSRAVTDTGYLIPFGAADFRALLRLLHPDMALAPSSVRVELEGLATRPGDRTKQQAARALLSRRGVPVQYRDIDEGDHNLRAGLLDELHQDAVAAGKAEGRRPPSSTANLGEAECLCLSIKGGHPMGCNDNGARRVAAKRGVATHTTASDLRKLLGHGYSPNQLVQIARRMQTLEIGDVVSGPGYFRRPRTG